MVRGKFHVTQVTQNYYPGSDKRATVKLTAATDNNNKTWAKYTPSGSIEMQIDNPEAINQFVPGESYFVDFTPAPAKEADETRA